jgi:hypothetical protein
LSPWLDSKWVLYSPRRQHGHGERHILGTLELNETPNRNGAMWKRLQGEVWDAVALYGTWRRDFRIMLLDWEEGDDAKMCHGTCLWHVELGLRRAISLQERNFARSVKDLEALSISLITLSLNHILTLISLEFRISYLAETLIVIPSQYPGIANVCQIKG